MIGAFLFVSVGFSLFLPVICQLFHSMVCQICYVCLLMADSDSPHGLLSS